MRENGWVKTTCGLCTVGCGLLVHLKDGKPFELKGDLENPKTHGAVCIRGAASLEYLYHPDRLKYPLKRIGERGQGKWEQIPWDEALEIIAEALLKAKNGYGVESVAFIRGASKGMQDNYMLRFANAFGTPNIISPASVCFVPMVLGARTTYGFYSIPDYEHPPASIIIWGANSADTNLDIYLRTLQALDKGTKLMVIDPFGIDLTKRAELWLQLRPGTDLALALAMIHTIINEGLFDRGFVDQWTLGFDELKTHVKKFPPEDVAEITWINSETIRKAARFYAMNKPACIQWGNGIEVNVNSFQSARAISILRAITGNLGIPGGELQWDPPPLLTTKNAREYTLQGAIPGEVRKQGISSQNKLIPLQVFTPPEAMIRTIIEEDPYPIHAAYIQGGNPLLSYANARETFRALKKLEFLAVVELFMTPTSALADIVLPAAGYLEVDSIAAPANYPIVQVQQKVAQIGECWSDIRILTQLAKKMGMGKDFWDDEEKCLDDILKPAGLTFEEFRRVGAILGKKKYRDRDPYNYETPSGKVELYSNQLKNWGSDPLPIYYELPETPFSAPQLAQEYPFILNNLKFVISRHSMGRQIPTLRAAHPDPIVGIHPETAKELGIKEGEWVYIETKRGRIKQKAWITPDTDPRVILVDFAWWYPEWGVEELFGWDTSNMNILTENKPPVSREMGSVNFRGTFCKVYKV